MIANILVNGSAIIKPAKIGFLKDNQLANEMINAAIKTFEIYINTLFY